MPLTPFSASPNLKLAAASDILDAVSKSAHRDLSIFLLFIYSSQDNGRFWDMNGGPLAIFFPQQKEFF
jgi:hypothetical protein